MGEVVEIFCLHCLKVDQTDPRQQKYIPEGQAAGFPCGLQILDVIIQDFRCILSCRSILLLDHCVNISPMNG